MKGFVRLFYGVCLLASVGSIGATTVEPRTGEELTAQADLIVVGRCVEAHSQWFGRSLATLATIEVDETLKGETGSQLVLAVPGGIDLDRQIAVTVPGAPAPVEGDEMLLFLNPVSDMDDTYSVLGVAQGFFPVVYEADTKAMVVQADGSSDGALGLDHVKAKIRAYLKAQEATQE